LAEKRRKDCPEKQNLHVLSSPTLQKEGKDQMQIGNGLDADQGWLLFLETPPSAGHLPAGRQASS